MNDKCVVWILNHTASFAVKLQPNFAKASHPLPSLHGGPTASSVCCHLCPARPPSLRHREALLVLVQGLSHHQTWWPQLLPSSPPVLSWAAAKIFAQKPQATPCPLRVPYAPCPHATFPTQVSVIQRTVPWFTTPLAHPMAPDPRTHRTGWPLAGNLGRAP